MKSENRAQNAGGHPGEDSGASAQQNHRGPATGSLGPCFFALDGDKSSLSRLRFLDLHFLKDFLKLSCFFSGGKMLQDASRLDYIRKDGSGHKVRVRRRLVETTQKGVPSPRFIVATRCD